MGTERVIAIAAFVIATAACEGGGRLDSDGGPIDPSAPSTLSSIEASTFSTTCAFNGCHAGPSPAQGLDLSTGQAFGNLFAVPSNTNSEFLRVKPGDAADSYLFMKLIDDPRIGGVQMPSGGTELDATRLAEIMIWIENGAPNN